MRAISPGQQNQIFWALTQIIGLSKEDIKKRIGISSAALRQLHIGYNPPPKTQQKLLALLENTTEELFQNSPPPLYGKEHIYLHEYRKLTAAILLHVQQNKPLIRQHRRLQPPTIIPHTAKAQRLYHLLRTFLSEGPRPSIEVFSHLHMYPRPTIYVAARNLHIIKHRINTGDGPPYRTLWALPTPAQEQP